MQRSRKVCYGGEGPAPKRWDEPARPPGPLPVAAQLLACQTVRKARAASPTDSALFSGAAKKETRGHGLAVPLVVACDRGRAGADPGLAPAPSATAPRRRYRRA